MHILPERKLRNIKNRKKEKEEKESIFALSQKEHLKITRALQEGWVRQWLSKETFFGQKIKFSSQWLEQSRKLSPAHAQKSCSSFKTWVRGLDQPHWANEQNHNLGAGSVSLEIMFPREALNKCKKRDWIKQKALQDGGLKQG